MVVYSFYIFDRHSKSFHSCIVINVNHLLAECIYSKLWARQDQANSSIGVAKGARPTSDSSIASNGVQLNLGPARARPAQLSAQDDAKLIFGTVFSLRNMVRKLGGQDDRWEQLQSCCGEISAHHELVSYLTERDNTNYTTTKPPRTLNLSCLRTRKHQTCVMFCTKYM